MQKGVQSLTFQIDPLAVNQCGFRGIHSFHVRVVRLGSDCG